VMVVWFMVFILLLVMLLSLPTFLTVNRFKVVAFVVCVGGGAGVEVSFCPYLFSLFCAVTFVFLLFLLSFGKI